ncbi:uncharacterized protein LOC143645690 [Tamandua tetradactyla]|uniref:uncharacterized protein LOC143645690 n=1 Tax=Tamandua tetradactyla TaxID=48850 RepID=UPI004053C125
MVLEEHGICYERSLPPPWRPLGTPTLPPCPRPAAQDAQGSGRPSSRLRKALLLPGCPFVCVTYTVCLHVFLSAECGGSIAGNRGCGQQGCWAQKPGHRRRVAGSGQGPHAALQLGSPGQAPTPQLEPQQPLVHQHLSSGGPSRGGQKPHSSGSSAEELNFQEGCGLQRDPLPESAGGDPVAGGDMPSSQATGPFPAQGEVGVDLSPVLSLQETVLIPTDDKLESVVLPMDHELESVVFPMDRDVGS